MKLSKVICRPTILLFAFVLISSQVFAAKSKEYEKKISEEFPITSDGTVYINNKYGNVDFKTWSQNKVAIEVTIISDSKSEEKAQETFDRIKINFKNSSSSVSAETVIEKKKGRWFNWGRGGSDKFKINYVVNLPQTNRIDLQNKYGDAFVGNIDNDMDIIIKYGNFNGGEISGDLDLELGYGKAIVESAGTANLDVRYANITLNNTSRLRMSLSYGGLVIDNAERMTCESKYSTLKLGKVNEVSINGKYDDIDIEESRSVDVIANYTDVKINRLHERADLDMRYGGAGISEIQAGFQSIDVACDYTGVKLEFVDLASFEVDAVTQHASIKYDDLDVSFEKEHNGKDRELKGKRGSGSPGMVKARMKYGSLKIY